MWSYNPDLAVTSSVWASTRSLATTCAITVVFSSSDYLDVSVHRVCFLYGYIVFNDMGSPIQTSWDQCVCAAPPSFSQLITSFFASESLGIPRAPFLTFFSTTPFCWVVNAFQLFTSVTRYCCVLVLTFLLTLLLPICQ